MARRDFRYRAPTREELDRRANQSGYAFEGFIKPQYKKFRPARGENNLRILPQEDASSFALPIWVHYSVGPDNASVLCLKQMDKGKCPLCEDRAKAQRRDDEEMARNLRPVRRSLVWIINRNDEREGPMLWDMPITLDTDLAKLARDRKTGEIYAIDHPDVGYDISFDREGEKQVTKYSGMMIARKPTSVEDEWLEFIREHPLPETLVWRDYDEVQELYQGVQGQREDPSERRPEPPRKAAHDRDDDDDTPPWEAKKNGGTDPYDEGEQEAVKAEPEPKIKSTVDALREKFKNRQA